jgi:signal transduction histidine kinase/CheY-like chemotaxis protein/HPt (histidine-containing phosphotransfer) domain-containing protein
VKVKFIKVLGVFLITALLTAVVGSFFFLVSINKQHLRELASSQMELIRERMVLNQQQIEDLTQNYNETNISKARSFSRMIALDPSCIETTEEMQEIADLLMVDEVHVTDENGVLLWGNIPDYYGLDFASTDQTSPFMPILDDPSLEIAQEAQPNGARGKLFQYTSVARKDKPGIVQVGMSPEALEISLANAAMSNVLKDYTIDGEGFAFGIDLPTQTIVAWPDEEGLGKRFDEKGIPQDLLTMQIGEGTFRYNGTEYYYISHQLDNMVVGFSIPNNKIYTSQSQAALSFAILNILIFVLLLLAISRLLQVHVIQGIRYVTGKIRTVAKGDLTVHLELHTNTDFAALSEDLNVMIRKIKQSMDNVQEKAEENAKMLQVQKRLYDDMTEAKRYAEEANKTKSKFLATMSHEIRTPMNAILGISQMILTNPNLPDDITESVNKIYISGHGLLGIINDILDLSKIESGKLEITEVDYDLPSLINDSAQLNVVRIKEKPITFLLNIDEQLPGRLCGDDLRLKQILNNLLSNAFKYTDAGEVKLTVTFETTPKADIITLIFHVEDTGQGMKKEDCERLFSEYARFNNDANRSNEGTGLGLSITKKLAELMDGSISVESEFGIGSKFSVFVKQRVASPGIIGTELAKKLNSFQFQSIRKDENLKISHAPMPYGRVLVVDDVETNLFVAQGLLSPYKIKVECTTSGINAVEMVKAGKIFDIIFMDHMMPKMDGVEATQILRALGYRRTIIALTANAIAGSAKMFMENGFDDFISKPIDVSELNSALHKYVKKVHEEQLQESSEIGMQFAVHERSENTKINESADIPERTDLHEYADMVKSADLHESLCLSDSDDAEADFPQNIMLQIKKVFIKDAAKAILTITEELKKGSSSCDLKTLDIMFHGMKSAAGNIEEKELSEAAKALEFAAKERRIEDVFANTESFIHQLEATIQKCTGEISEEDKRRGDLKILKECAKRIESACRDYDEETAKSILNDLEQYSWDEEVETLLSELSENLLHSDFEEAEGVAAKLSG